MENTLEEVQSSEVNIEQDGQDNQQQDSTNENTLGEQGENKQVEKIPDEISEDAKEYINPGQKNKTQKRIVNLLKERHEKNSEIEDLKHEIEKLKLKEKTRESNELKNKYDSELKLLENEMARAIEDGESEKASTLVSQISELSRNMPNVQTKEQNITEYFGNKFPWYKTDDRMEAYANSTHAKIAQDARYKDLDILDQLDIVARKTMDAFKGNPLKESVLSEGTSGAPNVDNDLEIPSDHIQIYMQTHNLTRQEAIKQIRGLKDYGRGN